MAESINGLYKAEVIHRKSWKNRAEVELATLTWVDWYNNRRLLERLGHIPPAEAKKLIMLPSETMIWQPEFTDKTLSRKPGAVQYDVLRQYVLMPGKVHADDIPVPVQEPGSGKTRTARLWVYVRDDRNAGSQMPRRSGSRTARTGKVSIHRITWLVTAVCFRQMLTVVTGRYTNPAE
ncbi:IS629 ORF2 [Shigella boydii]|nr:IS629 ORF2 [Shigella boydii]